MIAAFYTMASLPAPSIGLNPWVGLFLGVLLVLLNGFFVAAEFALVKVRPTQLDPYVAQGSRRGEIARHMVRHLDAYLSATQLGITLASLALGWIGEPAFAWLIEPLVMKIPGATPAMVHTVSLTTAFLVITILHIVLGELAPKSVAIRKPEATSLWVSVPLYLFYKVSYPAIWVLNHAANGLLKLVGIAPVSESELGHDEEELRLLLASTHASRLSEWKRDLLDNVFELSHRTARQVMVPRADVVYLSTTRTMDENLDVARESRRTRFPLCRGDLDQVIGLVHIKDLFRAPEVPKSLEEIAHPVAFVPETLPLDRLLRRMRKDKRNMVAVLDEYGGVSGIITLEDVLEEIVGEIQDEFDHEEPDFVKRATNVWDVSGSMLVADFEDLVELELSDRDEDTIAGVVLSELGRRPQVGDRVTLGDLYLEILQVRGNRILNVRVTANARPPSAV
jgi:CBS domain containing-hemolysin-like protein